MRLYLVITILLAAMLPAGMTLAAPVEEEWSIELPGGEMARAPVRIIGTEAFVDALSFFDALGVDYHRQPDGRYIFSFPTAPAEFAPGNAFARLDGRLVHFPIPAFREDFRFYVPETVFIDHVSRHAPGQIVLHRAPRRLTWNPARTGVISLDSAEGGDSLRISAVLSRPQPARVELLDSTRVALVFPETELNSPPNLSFKPGGILVAQGWETSARRLILTTRRAVRGARLTGPGDDCSHSLVLFFDDEAAGDASFARAGAGADIALALAEEQRKWVIDTIVIDAGHGGKDPGAIGKSGTREKDMTLDTALKLRDIIRRRLPGLKIVMTRDSDVFIPLHERTKIANESNGKLFVSIHFNSAASRNAHGIETYFLAPARTERAMQIAMKENSVIRYEEQIDLYPDLGDETFILLSMAQAQFSKESEDLATMVLDGMRIQTGVPSRGVDQAGFYVLLGASMPAILVEGGFLSNSGEEKLVRTKEYRQQVAESICEAIEAFIRKYEGSS